jgi:hypothetical protein
MLPVPAYPSWTSQYDATIPLLPSALVPPRRFAHTTVLVRVVEPDEETVLMRD